MPVSLMMWLEAWAHGAIAARNQITDSDLRAAGRFNMLKRLTGEAFAIQYKSFIEKHYVSKYLET